MCCKHNDCERCEVLISQVRRLEEAINKIKESIKDNQVVDRFAYYRELKDLDAYNEGVADGQKIGYEDFREDLRGLLKF